jgi:hypothetical protein
MLCRQCVNRRLEPGAERQGFGHTYQAGAAGPGGFAPDGSGYKSTVEVDYEILSDEDNEEFYVNRIIALRSASVPTSAVRPPPPPAWAAPACCLG